MFIIEYEGFNDGVPYEQERLTNGAHAVRRLSVLKKENPRVRWRLIQIVKDFDYAPSISSPTV